MVGRVVLVMAVQVEVEVEVEVLVSLDTRLHLLMALKCSSWAMAAMVGRLARPMSHTVMDLLGVQQLMGSSAIRVGVGATPWVAISGMPLVVQEIVESFHPMVQTLGLITKLGLLVQVDQVVVLVVRLMELTAMMGMLGLLELLFQALPTSHYL